MEKNQIIEEINSFGIKDLTLNDFNLLNGTYVNLTYPLSNGTTAQFLNDKDIYFANQIERPNSERAMVLLQMRSSFLFVNTVVMVLIRK